MTTVRDIVQAILDDDTSNLASMVDAVLHEKIAAGIENLRVDMAGELMAENWNKGRSSSNFSDARNASKHKNAAYEYEEDAHKYETSDPKHHENMASYHKHMAKYVKHSYHADDYGSKDEAKADYHKHMNKAKYHNERAVELGGDSTKLNESADHPDEAEDKKLIKKMVRKIALKPKAVSESEEFTEDELNQIAEELLNEISKSTLDSYVHKSFGRGNEIHAKLKTETDPEKKKALEAELSKRNRGVVKAAAKLTKEQREQIETVLEALEIEADLLSDGNE